MRKKIKQFAEQNLPQYMQEKADRMNLFEEDVPPYTPVELPFGPGCDPAAVRKEILATFAREMYGEIPPCCDELSFSLRSEGSAFDGLAIRKEIDITCRHNGITRIFHLLLYTPAQAKGKVPCFFTLNFKGNHTTTFDPEVTFFPFTPYTKSPYAWLSDGRASESERGIKAFQWEYETVLKAGFASATICYFDIFPDHPEGYAESIMPMFYSEEEYNSPQRKSAAISAWSWGVSRALDVLTQLPEIDAERIAVAGLSRLGKVALWAGANDERIKLSISICSGTGGAKMTRRYFGENMEWLENWRTYWFVPGFFQYVCRDTEIPFDQQQMMACIAPRKMLVASATNDAYADPEGEFLATKAASKAWEFYGKSAWDEDIAFPEGGKAAGNADVHYFRRIGEHSFTPENWQDILEFVKNSGF